MHDEYALKKDTNTNKPNHTNIKINFGFKNYMIS